MPKPKSEPAYQRGVAKRLVAADQIDALKSLFSLTLLDQSQKDMEMRAKILRIPVEDVEKAKSWLFSEFPETYRHIDGAPDGNLRLLLDENLPYALAPQLHKYGYVSSVFMKGLVGKQDVYIYGYARLRDEFNAIVTRDRAQKPNRTGLDRDLTNVALDRVKNFFEGKPLTEESLAAVKKFPQIIHLPSENPYRDGTVETFKSRYDEIYKLIDEHNYHIIQVTPSGVFPRGNSSLVSLWHEANGGPESANDNNRSSLPTSAAKLIKYSKRVAGSKNVDIKEIMGYVRSNVKLGFKRLLKTRKDITKSDILDLVHDTLNDVKDTYKTDNAKDSFLIFEMVLKALEKSVDEQLVSQVSKKTRRSPRKKNDQSPSPS